MAIRKEATINHGFTQEEITEAVKAALESLWGCTEKEPALFESDIGMTLNSFGEVFTVDLTEAGVIKIASETKLPTALIDMGKNQGNINKFLDALKETLTTSGLAQSKPAAYSSLFAAGNTEVRDASSRREGYSTILLILIIAAILIALAVGCIISYWIVTFFVSSL